MDAPRTLATTLVSVCLAAVLSGCDDAPEDREDAPVRDGAMIENGEIEVACEDLPDDEQLEQWLRRAPEQGEAGGLFSGRFEWATVVNRQGEICAVAAAQENAASMWPGSLAISKAKAYTANAFSTDTKPMSTARLYTMSQPGQSLWGISAGNPFNPACLTTPEEPVVMRGEVCGGTIAFGGGLALYADGVRVGGLGVSGDTACADHEIAKRIREMAQLVPAGGTSVDDIVYASVDGPSTFAHPLCPNTWRDGKRVGEANPVQGYQQLQVEVQQGQGGQQGQGNQRDRQGGENSQSQQGGQNPQGGTQR